MSSSSRKFVGSVKLLAAFVAGMFALGVQAVSLSDFSVTETTVVSATLSVTVETEEPCELYAVYGHGEFCRTNLLDQAATSAVGREFDLANLAPGTDYSVYLYAQNPGDAVARTEILSFSTGAEICGFSPSTEESGKWSAAQYFSGQWRKVEGNVLAGLSTETSKGNAFQQEEQTTSKTGKELTDEIVTTTYDKSTLTAIHTDEILTWHLTEPADLQEVVLISRWGDKGRDGIDVKSVDVLTVDEPEAWRTVSSEAVSARDGGGTYSVRASLKPENDNNVLAKGVTDLRIVFGSVENGYVGMEEIVAVAKADGDVAPPSAAVTGYDGEVLMLELSREGRDASAVKVYAGENYGGENSLGWTELDVGALAFAEGTGALSVTLANIPAAVRYIRLFSEKDGWMPTVLLDELTVNHDPQVKLSNFAVTETRIGGAILSVEVGSIGYGATAYDLAVVYGRDGTVVRRMLCTGSTQKGPAVFELTGLKPDTEYTVKLVASNGLAEGAAETPELIFRTEREALVIRPRFFEPVEYIGGTGSQTVDTGVYPSSSTVSQMKYREATSGGGVFYGREPDDHDDYRFFKFGGASYFDMPGDLRLQDSTVLGSGVNEVELGNYYILNMLTGKRIDQGTILGFESRDYTLGLFDANDYGDVYWLRIFEGGELVRDFIPVQDAAGDGFLFDLVNGNRAENDGTAPLLVGPALKSVQVESCVRSGDSVTVGLSLRGFVGATELAACVGNVYGGEDLVNWTSAETFELFGGVIYTTIAIPRERIADWTYLRFNSADLGWSQTIMVEEIPEKTAGGLRVVEVGQPIATADDAALTVTLDDDGAGIVGDVFAVTAFQYFNGVDATVITQTNRVLKTVGAGEYAVSLKNLCPQSRYELSFLVTTASGTEVFPAKEPLALVTDAEAYPDGSSRLSVTTGASKSGKLQFTATCANAAKEDVTLYAAYGKSYGGDDPSCWGHVEAIGAVWEADEAVLSSQTPAMGRSTTYLRFFTSDGRWSNTVFIPAIGFHPKQGFAVILR